MLKTNTKVICAFAGIISIVAGVQASVIFANQAAATKTCTTDSSTGEVTCDCTGEDCDYNMTFQVNVVESLSVTLDTPTSGASGAMETFLRNRVNLEVATNSSTGFDATMHSDGTTNLTNTTSGNSETLPTLTADTTRANFPYNYWGYSLGETTDGAASGGDTLAGDTSSTYKPMSATEYSIAVLSKEEAGTDSRNIYFGTWADANQASGTYTGTVIFTITSDVTPDSNPSTYEDDDDDSDDSGTYASTDSGTTNNYTVYSTSSTNETTGRSATYSQVSTGDTSSNNYVSPLGVTDSQSYYSNIHSGTPLAIGLAVTSAVAATSGIFFFILAKRKKDEEEEEENQA